MFAPLREKIERAAERVEGILVSHFSGLQVPFSHSSLFSKEDSLWLEWEMELILLYVLVE